MACHPSRKRKLSVNYQEWVSAYRQCGDAIRRVWTGQKQGVLCYDDPGHFCLKAQWSVIHIWAVVFIVKYSEDAEAYLILSSCPICPKKAG